MLSSPSPFDGDRGDSPWRFLTSSYCVNLDRRPERWSFVQQQLADLRLPAIRWSAVDGQSLDVPALAEHGIVAKNSLPRYFLPDEQKLFGVDLTAGGIGCALSHMQIWKDIVERFDGRDDACFLVFEDDCKFLPGFSEAVLAERIAEVPSDWEIVFLGGQDLMRKQHELEVGPRVRRLYRGFRETTAYLITVAGAKACLEVSVPLRWQIDTHLNDGSMRVGPLQEDPKLEYTLHPRGYCLFPPLVYQEREGFPTDVQKQ